MFASLQYRLKPSNGSAHNMQACIPYLGFIDDSFMAVTRAIGDPEDSVGQDV